MARDMNFVMAIGRVTMEPEYKMTPSGKALLKFSVAVNSSHDKEKNKVSFFPVNLWGKFAEVIKPYLIKGGQVAVQGRLQQNRWEQDGQKRSRIEIVADNLQLLSSPRGAENQPTEGQYEMPTSQKEVQSPAINQATGSTPAQPTDDFVPF